MGHRSLCVVSSLFLAAVHSVTALVVLGCQCRVPRSDSSLAWTLDRQQAQRQVRNVFVSRPGTRRARRGAARRVE
ncbi:hypothetical protein J6590_053817 [Homalodisca vitripennis]|nr:hypothetical protein J6590_053817 [Homalodisca vitripennis]